MKAKSCIWLVDVFFIFLFFWFWGGNRAGEANIRHGNALLLVFALNNSKSAGPRWATLAFCMLRCCKEGCKRSYAFRRDWLKRAVAGCYDIIGEL